MSTFKALVAGALVLTSISASAAPMNCSLTFNPEARQWDAVDSIELLKQIAKNSNIEVQDDVDLLSRTLMSKLGIQMRPEVLRATGGFEAVAREFDNALHRENRIRDLMHLKFGLPKDEPAVRWAERQVLEKGLMEFLNAAGDQPIHDKTLLDKVRIKIAKILDRPLLNRIQAAVRDKAPILSDLPDRDIPNDLMATIIRDGIPAHQDEIDTLYRASGQKRTEMYRSIQRAASVAAVVIVAAILFQKYEDFTTVTVQETDPEVLKLLNQVDTTVAPSQK